MTNQLIILIIVDVIGALSTGNIENNIYLIDNNSANGSGNQGSFNRTSQCSDGQIITWKLFPVDSATNVEIQNIFDVAVPSNIQPEKFANGIWGATVSAHERKGTAPYSCTLTMDCKIMSFNAAIIIT